MRTTDPDTKVHDIGLAEAGRLLVRLALQAKATVDVPHMRFPGHRFVGFIIESDEHRIPDEGILMMRALQRVADIDLDVLSGELADMMNQQADLTKALAENT